MKLTTVVYCASVLLLGALSTFAADDILPGAKRILFLGDSITYDGKYVAYVETELRLRQPDRSWDIVDCGLPSETVSGCPKTGTPAASSLGPTCTNGWTVSWPDSSRISYSPVTA